MADCILSQRALPVQVSGNVNPAAEANIFGDPEAADYVFKHTKGDTTYVVGLDVTHDCVISGTQLASLKGTICTSLQTLVCACSRLYVCHSHGRLRSLCVVEGDLGVFLWYAVRPGNVGRPPAGAARCL